jgi:hypothetical protein
MNLFEELRNDARALALAKDWIGDGGVPVPQEQATRRADACTVHHGRLCPENVEPGWWDRFKMAVADTIKAQIELKNRLGLSVPQENNLAMCRACGCCLPLKVHVPISYIAKHTSETVKAKLPPWCWQKQELNSYVQFHNGTKSPPNN